MQVSFLALVVLIASLVLSGCVADPPPIIGTATAGDGQAAVSWQPPLTAPGPITAYVVTPWIGFARQTPTVFNSAATTETVTGLTNGVTYTFTVHAVNAHGDESAESGMSNAVTPKPAIGQEFPVSDPVYGPNPHDHRSAKAAFDGTDYFVVWSDQRTGGFSIGGPTENIFGARVAPDGTVLDANSIPITRRSGRATDPDVTFDGTNFLVVWQYFPDVDGGPFQVNAARVSPSGVLLDTTPIPLVGPDEVIAGPSVAVGNGSSLVVWSAERPEDPNCEPPDCTGLPAIWDVLGERVAPDGAVLDANPIVLDTISELQNIPVPAIAYDGTNYLVTFNVIAAPPPLPVVTLGISGLRANGTTGARLCCEFQISSIPTEFASPSLAFDGTNFVVSWIEYVDDETAAVRGARVSPAGTVLDPSGFDISTTPTQLFGAGVAFDGVNTVVAWEDATTQTVLIRRIDGTGTPVDAAPVAVASGANPGVAAAGNGVALVAFGDDSTPAPGIEAARVSSGTVLDDPPFLLTMSANDQQTSAIASNGSGSFVVWEDARSGTNDIYGARVQDGPTLDGTGIPISTAPFDQTHPAVASDGSGYFVVWAGQGGDIYGARVTADGVLLDPGGIDITNTPSIAESDPAVAFDGTNYFVVWGDGLDATSSFPGVLGARVSTSGAVLDPSGITVSTSSRRPAVTFGGGGYLVTFENANGFGIGGRRVATDGSVLDPADLLIGGGANPQVAFNGNNFLVVWEKGPSAGPFDVNGARVTPDGVVLEPYPANLPISTAPDDQSEPHVAANPATGEFFVVWRDDRTRGAGAQSSDIYAARVTDAGVVRDPSGIAVTNTNQDKREPVIAPKASAGSWDVAYTRFAGGPTLDSLRIFHRSVTPN
jgi:hypothetical protein